MLCVAACRPSTSIKLYVTGVERSLEDDSDVQCTDYKDNNGRQHPGRCFHGTLKLLPLTSPHALA